MLTHTSWDLSSSKDHERRGWHPVTYKLANASTTLIQSIKDCVPGDGIVRAGRSTVDESSFMGKPLPVPNYLG
ncbi:Glycosyltransferase BC10 [Camellia lanceoleosa]|uniref:Glycosyltransferase BC10 n=1 Tax=Camellia lanceoleosa TaxID=1840588 RepID=A0ACC0H1W6_9ERIC|nr:Glycosyltransferase BC10 [Camellia lanceoleosa]